MLAIRTGTPKLAMLTGAHRCFWRMSSVICSIDIFVGMFEEPMDETWKIKNFITGEEVPVGRVTPPGDEPPPAFWQGWEDCMNGESDTPPIWLASEDVEHWKAGYAAAERD
jgi:hypothetical protein